MGLFSNPEKFKIIEDSTTDVKAVFDVGGVFYKVWGRFNNLMSDTNIGNNVWEIFFAMCEEGEDLVYGKHDITPNGSGDAIKVFSTVIDFMEYLGKTKDPDVVTFSVDTIKQRKIYLRLIRRYQQSGRLESFSISNSGNIITINPVR